MRNLFRFTVMSAVIFWALPVFGATVRDNHLYFEDSGDSTVKGFGWHEATKNGHKITDGQPWESISSEYNDGKGTIHIRAGRKGSEEVAAWFKERALENGYGYALGTWRDNASPGWPDKLNFATYGDMHIKDENGRLATCRGLVIGQGHTADGRNNWWIGGSKVKVYSGEYWLICPSENCDYCGAVVPISSIDDFAADNFNVTFWVCPPANSCTSSSRDVLGNDNVLGNDGGGCFINSLIEGEF